MVLFMNMVFRFRCFLHSKVKVLCLETLEFVEMKFYSEQGPF